MKTAFEKAIEISYYAGKLWDVATNPDISQGRTLTDCRKILIPKYGQSEDGQTLLSGNVPQLLREHFEDLAKIGIEASDVLTRGSLQNSIATLQRVASLDDPAQGYTTHFSNLQQPLISELPRLKAIASDLKLEHA
jgi:hypothetical protein